MHNLVSIEQRIEKAEALWKSFELVAYFSRTDGTGSQLCRRNA